MNDLKPTLRLMIVVQIFVLFLMLAWPALIRSLQQPLGKFAYGLLAVLCILQALLLRRALAKLD